MDSRLDEAISAFGAAATAKLTNPAVQGEPEDQIRAPLERLLADLAEMAGSEPASSSQADLTGRRAALVRSSGTARGRPRAAYPGVMRGRPPPIRCWVWYGAPAHPEGSNPSMTHASTDASKTAPMKRPSWEWSEAFHGWTAVSAGSSATRRASPPSAGTA